MKISWKKKVRILELLENETTIKWLVRIIENEWSKTVKDNLLMVPKENSSKLCIPWLKLGVVSLLSFP
jgi:hypothetical protein